MEMPENPILLMSLVNTKLRDEYSSLDEFCEDEDISKEELLSKLNAAGYQYIKEINQFR